MDRPLILASASPYRRQLLDRLGLSFAVQAADIDESRRPGEPPEDLVRRLAAEKARTVAARHPDALVIGSDQLAVLGDEVLGKPGTEARAVEQLAACSGRDVRFLTAVCLSGSGEDEAACATDETVVVFRELSESEIRDYVARERPLDSAGSFKAESLGIVLFSAIRSSDPTAIIGLPLIALCELLRAAGVRLPGGG